MPQKKTYRWGRAHWERQMEMGMRGRAGSWEGAYLAGFGVR
jgi:hypothetical protein